MFDFILRKLRSLSYRQGRGKGKAGQTRTVPTGDLDRDLAGIAAILGDSPDVIVRRFVARIEETKGAMVFIDGLTDKTVIDQHILRPLLTMRRMARKPGPILERIRDCLLSADDLKTAATIEESAEAVLTGDTALFLAGCRQGLIVSTKGWEKRGISEPGTEIVVKGPRDGFVETLRTNTALLRRKMGHPGLTFEQMIIGRKTRTEVSIAYLRGLTAPGLVEEVKRRLRRVETDAILSAGALEEFIEDAPFSLFSTVAYTERPDVCAAKLLEGRVAILVDGTPTVNTVPMLFIEAFQSPDDYTFRSFFTTLIRWSRYLAFTLSILAPALYVALTNYHQEVIPTPLLIVMSAAEEGRPFPAAVEAFLMGVIFEILREAGIRLPRPIGQAVSIVGALVIGQATVSAGLVGAPVVIMTSLTAISLFAVPKLAETSVFLRLFLLFMSAALGAFGILVGLLFIHTHLATVRSFGVPYFAPLVPLIAKDLKDVAVRAPQWAMSTRPDSLGGPDKSRQAPDLEPQPPKEDRE